MKDNEKNPNRKLPEILEHDFIICDNTLNRRGWRLLVEGIDLVGFLKNPVCCTQHYTYSTPVGKWKNLRVENEQLLGTVEFDRNDDEAVRLYWKYEDGYMNAVSLNVIPIEESSDPSVLLPGQKYPTLTRSELLEISLVTIPGQKNAVKLSTPDGEDYKLNIISNINLKTMEEKPKTNEDELKNQLSLERGKSAKNLVELHKLRGVVQDGEVESLTRLAVNDYETVETMLSARTPVGKKEEENNEEKELSAQIKGFIQNTDSKKLGNEREGWSFYDYFRKDPKALSLMRENEPEKYKKLEANYAQWAAENNLETNKPE